MSSSVVYVVAIPGRDFVELLSHPPSAKQIDELCNSGSLYDASLMNDPQEFLIDLAGAVTIIWLPIKSSLSIVDPAIKARLEAWEKSLRSICTGAEILRVDEVELENLPDFISYWSGEHVDPARLLESVRKLATSVSCSDDMENG